MNVRTFDLHTGGQVDVGAWYEVLPPAESLFDFTTDQSLFAQAMNRMSNRKNDPCWDYVSEMHFCKGSRCEARSDHQPTVFPTFHGLAVSLGLYPAMIGMCYEDYVVLPWKDADRALKQQKRLP